MGVVVRKVNFAKIDALRLDMGLTETEFCRQLRMNHSTYRRLAYGPEKVKDMVILKIADKLRVKPSELIYWIEDGQRHEE